MAYLNECKPFLYKLKEKLAFYPAKVKFINNKEGDSLDNCGAFFLFLL